MNFIKSLFPRKGPSNPEPESQTEMEVLGSRQWITPRREYVDQVIDPLQVEKFDKIRAGLDHAICLPDVEILSHGEIIMGNEFAEVQTELVIPANYFDDLEISAEDIPDWIIYSFMCELYSLKSGPAQLGMELLSPMYVEGFSFTTPRPTLIDVGEEKYYTVPVRLINYRPDVAIELPEGTMNMMRFTNLPLQHLTGEELQAALAKFTLPAGSYIENDEIVMPVDKWFHYQMTDYLPGAEVFDLAKLKALSARDRANLDSILGIAEGMPILCIEQFIQPVICQTGDMEVPPEYMLIVNTRSEMPTEEVRYIAHSSSRVIDAGFKGHIRAEIVTFYMVFGTKTPASDVIGPVRFKVYPA